MPPVNSLAKAKTENHPPTRKFDNDISSNLQEETKLPDKNISSPLYHRSERHLIGVRNTGNEITDVSNY